MKTKIKLKYFFFIYIEMQNITKALTYEDKICFKSKTNKDKFS